LQAADDASRALSYVSAIAMEEKEIWDYNQGNPTGDPANLGKHALPKVPLVAIYPKEGTLAADHPYAILTAPWVTAEKRRAAEKFLQYLEDGPAQARFLAAGFRNQSGPGPVIIPANGMRPDLPGAYLRLPPASVIQAIQASWKGLRKRARVVLLIDRSALASGVDAHKLAQSVSAGIKQQLAGDDQVGLWVFPGPTGASLPYSDLVPVQPLEQDAPTLEKSIGTLQPSTSQIALYSSLGAADTAMGNSIDPARVNGVVLISPGHSTDPGDSARFPTLTAVNGIAGRVPGVHVFTIAVGKSPDRTNLHQIALEGEGASYDASDPTSISRALAALISNF
jgi:Ca-activated chloride channel family protein